MLYQTRGGLTEHYPTVRRDGLHPLRVPDGLSDRGMSRQPRAHLAGDDTTRIQTDTQPQRDVVLYSGA
jgi:hypothetical protein